MARQLAQATVNVFPSMKGFNTAIYAEFGSAGTQAGNRFNKGFTSSISGLKNTLTAMGNAYKQALGANTTNSGAGDKLAEQRIQAQNRLLSASKAVEAQEYKVQSARLRVEGATKQLANLETQLVRARLAGKDTSSLEARIATAKARVADATAKQTREEQKLQAVQAKHSTAQSTFQNIDSAMRSLNASTTATTGTLSGLMTRATAVGSALKTGFTLSMPAIRNLASEIAGVASGLATVAGTVVGGVVASNVSGGVERFDIMTRFPRMMKAMGVSTRDARGALEDLTAGIEGLPTKLPEIMQTFNQVLPSLNMDVAKTTKLTIALNNAMLAGGNGAEEAQRGLTQLLQLFSSGSFSDLRGWRSAMEVANVSMSQLAKYMSGGAYSSAYKLWDALKAGTYTMEDLQDAFIALNEGVDGYVSFADLARENTVGIDTSMRNMNTAVQNAIASFLDMSGAGALIRETLDKITGGIKAFRKDLDPVGAQISDVEYEIEDLYDEIEQGSELGIDTRDAERRLVELEEQLEGLKSKRAVAGVEALSQKFGLSKGGFASAITVAAGALAPLLSRIPLIGGVFAGVTAPISGVITVLTLAWQNSQKLRDTFAEVGRTIASSGLGEKLSVFAQTAFDFISKVSGMFGDSLAGFIAFVAPSIGGLVEKFAEVGTSIMNNETLIETLRVAFDVACDAMAIAVTGISEALQALGDFIIWMSDAITTVSDWLNPISEQEKAQRALTNATMAHERALMTVSEAQDALNRAYESGDADAIARAEANLTEAYNLEADALALLDEAQNNVADTKEQRMKDWGLSTVIDESNRVQQYVNALQSMTDAELELERQHHDTALAFGITGDEWTRAWNLFETGSEAVDGQARSLSALQAEFDDLLTVTLDLGLAYQGVLQGMSDEELILEANTNQLAESMGLSAEQISEAWDGAGLDIEKVASSTDGLGDEVQKNIENELNNTQLDSALSLWLQDAFLKAKMQHTASGVGGGVGNNLGSSVATGVRAQTGNVSNAGGSLIASTVNRMSAGVGSAYATGSRVGQNTAGGINASSGQAVGAGSSLMSRVYSAMSGMLGGFQGLGSSIASGLTKGINLGSSGVSSSASTLVSKAYEAAKKRADVNSPSKLFRDGIGLSIGEGLAVGIEQSTPMVTTAVENAITDASKVANTMGSISLGVDSNIASQGRLGGNMGMSGGNYTQNITLYETNPASVAQVIENRWTQLVGV